jgi:hypothetical protein
MGYALFAISAYIFMRAFEVLFADQKDKSWCRIAVKIISCAVLYTAIAAMIWFYFNRILLLGFDPK